MIFETGAAKNFSRFVYPVAKPLNSQILESYFVAKYVGSVSARRRN